MKTKTIKDKWKRWTLAGVSLGVLLAPPLLSTTSVAAQLVDWEGNTVTGEVTKKDSKDSGKKEDKDDKKSSSSGSSDSSSKSSGGRKDNEPSGSALIDSPLTAALLANGLSNEDYTGLDTNYLYRGYADIADYSRMYYGNIMGDNISTNGSLIFNIGSWSEGLSTMFPKVEKKMGSSDRISPDDIRSSMQDYLAKDSSDKVSHQTLMQRSKLGFMNDRKGTSKNGNIDQRYMKRIYAPISSNTIAKASLQDLRGVKVGDQVGLDQDYFILSKRNFNNHRETLQEQMARANKATTGISIPQEDAVSLSAFALYTESPFYYFSWLLYDNGLNTRAGSSGEFKTMMLENNDSFFYNYQIDEGRPGYGAMKDFLDFGSLFTVTIPYLREANKTLLQWSDTYGTKPYAGYGTTKEDLQKITNTESEAYYKTWFNLSSDNAYRTYTAWVDYLYELDIAKPEEITYAGEKQVVYEPMNPASYTLRPMVFSESEMLYYGLKESDLTQVEKKIQEVTKEVRNDWLNVMNYYTLDDVVLNTASAMIATFDFNRIFSQNGFNQRQVVFEPQNFELKSFGWDAYLRMILQNATGESIVYNQTLKSDIYEIVAEKDGFTTLVMMWFNSFVVVYLVPTLLILILCSLPIAMLLSIFASFIRQDKSMVKSFTTECMMPFLTVLIVNIMLAFTVSILMGEGGHQLVTGELGNNQSFNSPRSTMGVLIFVTIIACALYWSAVLNLFRGLYKNARIVSIPVKAGAAMVGGLVTGGIEKMKDIAGGVDSSVSGASNARLRDAVSDARASVSGGLSAARQAKKNLGGAGRKYKRTFGKNTKKSKVSEDSLRANKQAQEAINDVYAENKSKQRYSDFNKSMQDVVDRTREKQDSTFKEARKHKDKEDIKGIFDK